MNAFAALQNYQCSDVNLALNKSANQSSTFKNAVASLAVDGSTSHLRSCTLYEVRPWWSVDLGAAYDVGRVIVINDNSITLCNYRHYQHHTLTHNS